MRIRKHYIRAPLNITIAASVRSPDIRALALSAGWAGYEPIICTINAGVDVATLSIANIPDRCLTIINRGRIGGTAGIYNGTAAGTGLYTRTRISIDNSAGTIFGGGGAGGRGEEGYVRDKNTPAYNATGYSGDGGNGAGFNASGAVKFLAAAGGTFGTLASYDYPGNSYATVWGGDGGAGGAMGAAGTPGGYGGISNAWGNYSSSFYYRTDGSPAGNYADGASYITWLAVGSRLGPAIN